MGTLIIPFFWDSPDPELKEHRYSTHWENLAERCWELFTLPWAIEIMELSGAHFGGPFSGRYGLVKHWFDWDEVRTTTEIHTGCQNPAISFCNVKVTTSLLEFQEIEDNFRQSLFYRKLRLRVWSDLVKATLLVTDWAKISGPVLFKWSVIPLKPLMKQMFLKSQ